MVDQLHNQLRLEHNPDGSVLRTIQLKLLDILVDLAKICEDNGVHYILAYGTMLGAVRHKGFIPWDDDIDIMVPQSEIKKLKESIIRDGRYDWQDHDTDRQYYQHFFKVRSKRDFINEPNCDSYKFKGLYVDVFPVEKMPSWMPRFGCRVTTGLTEKIRKKSPGIAGVFYDFSSHVTIPVLRFISSIARKKEYYSSYGHYEFSRLLIKSFDDVQKADFENHLFYIPKDFDACLAETFGNYMEIPERAKRPTHAAEFILDGQTVHL